MTAQYTELRNQIVAILAKVEIPEARVYFRKDKVPFDFPAAMVILEGDEGVNPSLRTYNSLKLQIAIYLLIKIDGVEDPDIAIMTMKETFRTNLIKAIDRDIVGCEYCDATADSRRVRVAKLNLEYVI